MSTEIKTVIMQDLKEVMCEVIEYSSSCYKVKNCIGLVNTNRGAAMVPVFSMCALDMEIEIPRDIILAVAEPKNGMILEYTKALTQLRAAESGIKL